VEYLNPLVPEEYLFQIFDKIQKEVTIHAGKVRVELTFTDDLIKVLTDYFSRLMLPMTKQNYGAYAKISLTTGLSNQNLASSPFNTGLGNGKIEAEINFDRSFH
jgi:hypothetical protein